MTNYTFFDRKTARMVANGSLMQCSRQLGIGILSLVLMVSVAYGGARTKYLILRG